MIAPWPSHVSIMELVFHLGSDKNDKTYYFDRSPRLFEYVLEYLRTGEVNLDGTANRRAVALEAQYFGLQPMVEILLRWVFKD